MTHGVLTQLVRARRRGPRAVSALREGLAGDPRLGYGHLGTGAVLVGAVLFVRGLIGFLLELPHRESAWLGVVAWMLLTIAYLGSWIYARHRGGRLPILAFAGVLVLLGAAAALELLQTGSSPQPLLSTTTLFGVGATLLALVGFRPTASLVLANALFGALLFALVIASARASDFSLGPAVHLLAVVLLPGLIGMLVVQRFGRLIRLELDRSLAQSALSTPRFAFGMRASDELARLDLDAERILDGVASGALPLPLEPEVAASASSIATELRLVLLAGRTETWLHHAIEESETLGPVVTLLDPQGLAGFLDPDQREGLLSAVWLLVADAPRVQPTVHIEIGPKTADPTADTPARMGFPIHLAVESVTRRAIDPAVWTALARVGRHTETVASGGIVIVTTVRTEADVAVS